MRRPTMMVRVGKGAYAPFGTLAMVAALALSAACATRPAAPTGRLAPVGDRISDEAIERDLETFASMEQRLDAVAGAGTGSRTYLVTRAREYLSIAREAYERNDRSTFPEDALGWAATDIETLERNSGELAVTGAPAASVPRAEGTAALWARADSLRAATTSLGGAGDLARAEGGLLRAAHPFLAGPACVDESPTALAARLLDSSARTRVTPDAPAPVPTPVPTPTPTRADTSGDPRAAANRPTPPSAPAGDRPGAGRAGARDCTAPDRLAGVPGIVHFALDKSHLAPTTREVLDRLVERLRPYPGIHVVIGGHTDPRAPDDYNQALSERRVQAVRDYLLAKGMAPERIESGAFGERRPLVPGTSMRDHARNRRVELVYTLCDGERITPVEQLNDLQLESARRRRAPLEKD